MRSSRRTRRLRVASSARLAVAAAFLVASCSDPRGRPLPPEVSVRLTPGQPVTSPGTITGTVHARHPDGLDRIVFSVNSSDGIISSDTTIFPEDPFEITWPFSRFVASGMAAGIEIRFSALARSFVGFAAADTVLAIVGDTTRQSR